MAGLLVPTIGVHAASDQFANEHAGAWRGIMHHKNAFGALMAYAVALAWPFGRALIAYRPALWTVEPSPCSALSQASQ